MKKIMLEKFAKSCKILSDEEELYKITNSVSYAYILLNTDLENLIKKVGLPSVVGSGDNKV